MGSSPKELPLSTERWQNDTAAPGAAPQPSFPWVPLFSSPSAASQMGWPWALHCVGFASLSGVLALLSFFTALRLRARLSARPHFASLCGFLGLMATARMLVLFLDPYGSRQSLPPVLRRVLWDLGYPCLVSAQALLRLALARGRDEGATWIVLALHFLLVITSGVLAALQHSLAILWLITQIGFLLWGGFLCISCFLDCMRVLRSLVKGQQIKGKVDPGTEIQSIRPQSMFSELATQPPPPHQPRIHITDENDRTVSYASEGSIAAPSSADPQRAIVFPLRGPSPSRWSRPDCQTNEDPAVILPLISIRSPADNMSPQHPVLSPSALQPPISPNRSSPSSVPRLKCGRVGRQKRQLRRLLLTSALGGALCLLEASGVIGGLAASSDAQLTWFCLQSAQRIVEFTMAYAMVYTSQHSLNSRYYYYAN